MFQTGIPSCKRLGALELKSIDRLTCFTVSPAEPRVTLVAQLAVAEGIAHTLAGLIAATVLASFFANGWI